MKPMLLLALAATIAAPLAAQHPEFSGVWIVDPDKSSATGSMNAPTSGGWIVVHHGDSLTVDTHGSSGGTDYEAHRFFLVDGKAWSNALNYGGYDMQLSSVLGWKEKVLQIHTTSDYQGTPVEQNETWTLSADGKVLTQTLQTLVNGAEYAAMTVVLNKKD